VEAHLIRAFLSVDLVALFAVVAWRYALDGRERLLLGSGVAQVLLTFRMAR
jgi:hypothetical protein